MTDSNAATSMTPIHIFFGSQTGTAEMVADELLEELKANGFEIAQLSGLDEVDLEALKTVPMALFICSTYGEGEMPDQAVEFYEKLRALEGTPYENMRYSVLALGDSSYEDFCAAGRNLDEGFARLWGQSIHPRQDCDVVYDEDAETWTAGLIEVLKNPQTISETPEPRDLAVHVFYGTSNGTAELVASDIEDALNAAGIEPKQVVSLEEITPQEFAELDVALIVCASHGEGYVAETAAQFYEALLASDAPSLSAVKYSLLAMGDSSFEEFCGGGKKLDNRLFELGAQRFHETAKCDIVYEDTAEAWTEGAIKALQDLALMDPSKEVPEGLDASAQSISKPKREKAKWTRDNPYTARVLENRLLSKDGSEKEMRHVVIDLGDDGPTYNTGDGLNIIVKNDPDLVFALLDRMSLSTETVVPGFEHKLGMLMSEFFEISVPSMNLIKFLALRAGDDELARIIANEDRDAIDAYLWNKDALDLLCAFPSVKIEADDIPYIFKGMVHRTYSIASSPLTYPHQVHLTVATVHYESNGRQHGGVATSFLADRLHAVDYKLGVYLSPNYSFKLPDNPDAAVVMVGPGSGIAPFIGFLQERAKSGARGLNWLFFGDQTRDKDFIYEDELNAFVQDGILNRLDLAFSRDQAHKIYVQDKMIEAGGDLFKSLEAGAYLYVCGDAKRMAEDVDNALNNIVATHGNMSAEAARDYIATLRKEKRYLRDVY